MILFIVFSIAILILFLPIPLKIKIEYLDKNLNFKIYKYTIFSSKNGIENKYIKKIIDKNLKNNKSNAPDTHNIKKKKLSLRKLYKNINSNKIKPTIKFSGDINYGLEDAALCAMLYGILCNIPSILYFFLNIIFKVKALDLNIKPNFNTLTFSFGITSIFYFNIVNIIYILYSIIKSMEIKEVAPN